MKKSKAAKLWWIRYREKKSYDEREQHKTSLKKIVETISGYWKKVVGK